MGSLGQTAPSPLVAAMAQAIAQMEGSNPAFASNNNVGNIVYIGPNQNGQTGVVRGAGGFAQFSSPDSGQQALYNQIQSQINSGQNLTQFFNQYAPGGTTNAAGGVQTQSATNNYVSFVSSQIGVDPSIPLNQIQSSYTGPGSISTSDTSGDDTTTFDLSNVTDALSNVDLTDPTTLVVLGIAGAGLLYVLFG